MFKISLPILFLLLTVGNVRADTKITGLLDVFIERTSVPGKSVIAMDSSGLGVSKLAVKTSEKVGQDTVVTAYLEGRFEADTGKASYDGSLFNRLLYLSLNNSFAKVSIGKQYSPHVLQLASEYDIFETSFWATPYAIFQGASRYTLIPDALSIELGAMPKNALKVAAMVANRTDGVSALPRGRQVFLSASYAISGQFKAGASIVRDHHFSPLHPSSKLALIGFAYDTGGFRVSAGMQALAFDNAKDRVNEFCVGGGYWFNPHDQFLINYAKTYEPGAGDRKSAVYGIALVRNLSKRTALYGSIGRMVNGREYKNYFDVPVQSGETTANVMMGIRHSY